MPATVFIDRVDTVAATTLRLARRLRLLDAVPRDADVFLKLNLTADDARTNTGLETVEALVELLRQKTTSIHLCEADAIRWTAEEAFDRNGYTAWARQHGVALVYLSREAEAKRVDPRMEDFGLPQRLLAADKVFITLPMIKTHHLTAFTGAIKNQWGTIPRVDRILLHRHLDELLPVINRAIGVDFAIMGGEWAMEGRGPTNGRTRRYPVMLASASAASLDAGSFRIRRAGSGSETGRRNVRCGNPTCCASRRTIRTRTSRVSSARSPGCGAGDPASSWCWSASGSSSFAGRA